MVVDYAGRLRENCEVPFKSCDVSELILLLALLFAAI